ncbi:hypothetical protein EBS40_02970 [bacterium]|nr:hypothetical protein [bacterium]
MSYNICPTVTAYSPEEYKQQIELVSSLSKRIHIDYMDGMFAPTVSQTIHESWWPKHVKADLHIMYKYPMKVIDDVLDHHPHLVIVHAESDHVSSFVHDLHEHRIKVGIALLPDTPAEVAHHFIKVIDHVLIFSGNLGHHGGHADLALLEKVALIKQMRPDIEIGWDGGIDEQNIIALKEAGVSVFNVGSAIHNADNPHDTYQRMQELIQS